MRRSAGLLFLALSGSAWAHPGGLNSEGCHNNRKTGDYHCHGGRGSGGATTAYGSRAAGLIGSRASSAYFPNCSTARAAGAAPIRYGQPGYSRRLDRDGDGVACE